jgi:hypothetical protein
MNIMVRATALGNVRGRVDYISNPKRQEYIEAVYTTAPAAFWKDLSAHCRKAAAAAGHEKVCEGREFMMALANELSKLDADELARKISEEVKQMTGTENTVALHWNRKHDNFHCHIVVAENKAVQETRQGAVLRQNTYYNAAGKRSTKKECLDEQGELLPGCRFYPKGSRVETKVKFAAKEGVLSSKSFLISFKQRMADLQNQILNEKRFQLFDGKYHIRQQHIGKGRPSSQEHDMRRKNAAKSAFNQAVDEIIALEPKRCYIEQKKAQRDQFYRKRIREIREEGMERNSVYSIQGSASDLEIWARTAVYEFEKDIIDTTFRSALKDNGKIGILLPTVENKEELYSTDAQRLLKAGEILQKEYNKVVMEVGRSEGEESLQKLRESRIRISEAAQEGLEEAFSMISQETTTLYIDHAGIAEAMPYLKELRDQDYFLFMGKTYREGLEEVMADFERECSDLKPGLDERIAQGQSRAAKAARNRNRQRQRDYDLEL